MNQYAHITKMENIMVEHTKSLKALNQLLDTLVAQQEAYRELMGYYYSEQRAQDLKDDENHLIPEELHRGVLSEDEIYELMGEYRDTAIRMLEIGVQMVKE